MKDYQLVLLKKEYKYKGIKYTSASSFSKTHWPKTDPLLTINNKLTSFLLSSLSEDLRKKQKQYSFFTFFKQQIKPDVIVVKRLFFKQYIPLEKKESYVVLRVILGVFLLSILLLLAAVFLPSSLYSTSDEHSSLLTFYPIWTLPVIAASFIFSKMCYKLNASFKAYRLYKCYLKAVSECFLKSWSDIKASSILSPTVSFFAQKELTSKYGRSLTEAILVFSDSTDENVLLSSVVEMALLTV